MRSVRRAASGAALAALAACAGGARPAATPSDDAVVSLARRGAGTHSVDEFVHIRRHTAIGFSPDGRSIAYRSDVTGRSQIWTVPTTGGWPTQVTFGDAPVNGAVWARDGTGLAFERDSGGNERYRVFTVAAGGGDEGAGVTPAGWRAGVVGYSDDRRFFAFTCDSGRSGHFELWLRDLWTGRSRQMTADSVSTVGGVWSHDSRYLALTRTDDFADVDAVLLDVSNARSRVLTSHRGSRAFTPVAFSPDDRELLLVSDARDGVGHLAILTLGTDSIRWLDTGPWPVEAAGWSVGGAIAYSEDADGRLATWLMAADGAHRRRVGPRTGVTRYEDFSADGQLVLVSHSDAAHPADLWVGAVARDTAWQVTYAAAGGVDSTDLAPSALVHYPTFDGRRVSAFVTVPMNLRRDGSSPAIVMAHGGPSGQWTDAFSRDVAYYANHGYVVIRPNVRGSTGYGKAFEDLNNGDWGGGDLRDLVAAADFLVATGYVARSKIAVLGGSYGGYLTLAALAFTPRRWAAGVDLYGISSIATLARTTDPRLLPYLTREMGRLDTAAARMRDRSPLFRAAAITAPLLILQGDADPRVPLAESREIAEAVRRGGGVVELVVYPGEGHGFERTEDQLDAMRRAVEFLDRYVKGRG